ncbi:MAG: hypothetical protein ABIG64_01275 [Candidatus Omnitrophota bacterium]
MHIIIGIALISVILFIMLIYSESKLGKKHYNHAISLEDEKKYDEACYYYGLAVFKGFKTKISKEKIKYLWKTYGPFDLSKFMNTYEGSCKYTSCDRAGHTITVDIIKKIIENL